MQVSILTAGTLGLRVGPALGELVLLLGRLCMWKQLLTSFICRFFDQASRGEGGLKLPFPPLHVQY